MPFQGTRRNTLLVPVGANPDAATSSEEGAGAVGDTNSDSPSKTTKMVSINSKPSINGVVVPETSPKTRSGTFGQSQEIQAPSPQHQIVDIGAPKAPPSLISPEASGLSEDLNRRQSDGENSSSAGPPLCAKDRGGSGGMGAMPMDGWDDGDLAMNLPHGSEGRLRSGSKGGKGDGNDTDEQNMSQSLRGSSDQVGGLKLEGKAAAVANDLTQVEMQNIRRMFSVYDADHSGSIDVKELRQMIHGLGIKITPTEVEKLMASTDTDGSHELEFDEFVQLILNNQELIEAARSRTIPEEEIVREALRSKRFMPDARWRWIWDTLQIVVILYWAITVPFWIVGAIRPSVYWDADLTAFLALDIFFSFWMFMDILVRLNTAFVEQSYLVTSFRSIGRHYSRRWLILDIIGILPIDIILRSCNYERTGPGTAVASAVRLLCITKVHRLFQSSEIDYYVTASYINFNYHIVPMMLLLFWSICFFHWCAVIAVALGIGNDGDDPTNHPIQRPSIYMNCLYWVMYTISTCGYGDVDILTIPQQVYTCILLFFSIVINGLVVAKLSDIVQNKSLQATAQHKMRETLTLLKHFNIPNPLRDSILSFQHHLLRHKLSKSHTEVIAELPGVMQDKLALHMRISFISNIQLFNAASMECRVQLAQRLRTSVVSPGEFLVVAGEVGMEMMLLSHGFAEVLSPEGEHKATLKPGNFFGVMALLYEGVRRQTSIRALTYCDLLVLSKDDFGEILSRFPKFTLWIKHQARQQMKRRRSFFAGGPNTSVSRRGAPGPGGGESIANIGPENGPGENASGLISPSHSPVEPCHTSTESEIEASNVRCFSHAGMVLGPSTTNPGMLSFHPMHQNHHPTAPAATLGGNSERRLSWSQYPGEPLMDSPKYGNEATFDGEHTAPLPGVISGIAKVTSFGPVHPASIGEISAGGGSTGAPGSGGGGSGPGHGGGPPRGSSADGLTQQMNTVTTIQVMSPPGSSVALIPKSSPTSPRSGGGLGNPQLKDPFGSTYGPMVVAPPPSAAHHHQPLDGTMSPLAASMAAQGFVTSGQVPDSLVVNAADFYSLQAEVVQMRIELKMIKEALMEAHPVLTYGLDPGGAGRLSPRSISRQSGRPAGTVGSQMGPTPVSAISNNLPGSVGDLHPAAPTPTNPLSTLPSSQPQNPPPISSPTSPTTRPAPRGPQISINDRPVELGSSAPLLSPGAMSGAPVALTSVQVKEAVFEALMKGFTDIITPLDRRMLTLATNMKRGAAEQATQLARLSNQVAELNANYHSSAQAAAAAAAAAAAHHGPTVGGGGIAGFASVRNVAVPEPRPPSGGRLHRVSTNFRPSPLTPGGGTGGPATGSSFVGPISGNPSPIPPNSVSPINAQQQQQAMGLAPAFAMGQSLSSGVSLANFP